MAKQNTHPYWRLLLVLCTFLLVTMMALDAWHNSYIWSGVIFTGICVMLLAALLLIVGDIILDMIDREETP